MHHCKMDQDQYLITEEEQDQTRQKCAVSASHLRVGTPKQHRVFDYMKITFLNTNTTLRIGILMRTVVVNQSSFASDHFPGHNP